MHRFTADLTIVDKWSPTRKLSSDDICSPVSRSFLGKFPHYTYSIAAQVCHILISPGTSYRKVSFCPSGGSGLVYFFFTLAFGAANVKSLESSRFRDVQFSETCVYHAPHGLRMKDQLLTYRPRAYKDPLFGKQVEGGTYSSAKRTTELHIVSCQFVIVYDTHFFVCRCGPAPTFQQFRFSGRIRFALVEPLKLEKGAG
jgi:hypothetical protein